MPNLRGSYNNANTTSAIYVVCEGLTYPAGDYYAINLYNSGGGFLAYMNSSGGGSSGAYYSSAVAITGLNAGTSYGFYCNIKYQAASTTTRVPSSGYYYDSTASSSGGGGGDPFASATTVSIGSTSGYISNSGEVDYYKFVPASTGSYDIYSTGSLDTVGTLYNSSKSQIDSNDDNNSLGGGTNFGFTNTLTAGNTYYISVRAYSSTTTGGYTLNIRGQSPPTAPTQAPTINTSYGTNGRGEGGFYVNVTAITGATSYVVRARIASTVYASVESTSTSAIWLGGLSGGTQYIIEYLARNSIGDSAWSPFIGVNTLPQTPQIKGSVISGGVQIRLDPLLSGNWTDVTVEVWNNAKSSLISSHTITYGSSTSVNITGLTNNTYYSFKARSRYYVNSTDLYSYSYSSWIDIMTGQKPAVWGWTTGTDGNGNKVAGGTFSMNASEWNTFQDRINEWRAYKGVGAWNFYSADTYSGTGAFTRASTGGTFYAWHMNQAITAINTMIATGVSSKSSGSDITASDLNTLKNKLNAIT